MAFFEHPQHLPDLDLTQLRKLPKEAVRLLWMSDYYDGLLEGVAEVHGKRCLLQVVDMDQLVSPTEVRRWVVYELTEEQHANEERWHTLFRQHVNPEQGDFTGKPPSPREGSADREGFFARYTAEYRPPRFRPSQAVGWCDDYTIRR